MRPATRLAVVMATLRASVIGLSLVAATQAVTRGSTAAET